MKGHKSSKNSHEKRYKIWNAIYDTFQSMNYFFGTERNYFKVIYNFHTGNYFCQYV